MLRISRKKLQNLYLLYWSTDVLRHGTVHRMTNCQTTLKVALLAFLRAELDSPTEGKRVEATLARLHLHPEVILGHGADAEKLWDVFIEYRGREPLFDGLDLRLLTWNWIALSREDLETRTFTSINHFEQTFGTRSPNAIAKIWDDTLEPNGVLDKIQGGLRLDPNA
ncbi:MAG: hypothetical protein HC802_01330 [Caldilineaceae bacterium]|nr:hypothetical protein [Caldilineaceae bacterium]